MIEMIEAVGHHNGEPDLFCPMFICEVCREPITKDRGIVQWARHFGDGEDGRPFQQTAFYFSHNGVEEKNCGRVVEAALRKAYPAADGWHNPWVPLKQFLAQLTHNYATDIQTDPEYTAYRLEIPAA